VSSATRETVRRHDPTTEGDGVESERWTSIAEGPVWIDYELCRHNDTGEVRWTWMLAKAEMIRLYAGAISLSGSAREHSGGRRLFKRHDARHQPEL